MYPSGRRMCVRSAKGLTSSNSQSRRRFFDRSKNDVFPTGISFGFGKGYSWTPLNTYSARHPIIFGSVVASLKTGFADWLTQKNIERSETIDWKRVSMFTTFGLLYLGGVSYFLYVPVMTRFLFPNARKFVNLAFREKIKSKSGQITVFKQVLTDLCVFAPLGYYPVFYLIKEKSYSDKPTWVLDALRTYKQNIVKDLTSYATCWGPALALNFGLCPMHMRVPFIALVSLLWTMYLSSVRGCEGRNKSENISFRSISSVSTSTNDGRQTCSYVSCEEKEEEKE